MIFVFGSNEAGIHGAGAALIAHRQHGAVWNRGFGHLGNSYAIPTKDGGIQTLPVDSVKDHVERFLLYATQHDYLEFKVTRIGCGLAGFTDSDIAPLFLDAPSNCFFDTAWKTFLPNAQFWGTF